MKKIEKKELESLQQSIEAVTKIKANIAELEIAKYAQLEQLKMVDSKLQAKNTELSKKYGNVTVNINTGEIKEKENESDKKD